MAASQEALIPGPTENPASIPAPLPSPGARGRLSRFLAAFGPGLVVMLADTDVGSVITAGQSGVQWGYRLLLIQILLMPVLYSAQELTIRLGLFTGRGHGELIRETFGPVWAWLSIAGLAVAAIGALLSEFSGVAAVGELYGIPRLMTLPAAAAGLIALVLTGSYRRVEAVAVAIGLFEFAFFLVAWHAHPAWGALAAQSIDIPFADRDYLYLVAANIGAVIMPWMIYYQQSAIVRKRLTPAHLAAARADTAFGAIVTQLVMAAVLVACAATIGQSAPAARLATIGDMAAALTPLLGPVDGRLVFSAGVLGAGMVAAIVASLALAWGVGEVTGRAHTSWFNAAYAAGLAIAASTVAVAPDLVSLNVGVQVANALLLPLVLGLVVALAVRALPPAVRLRGWYLCLVVAVLGITAALALAGTLAGLT